MNNVCVLMYHDIYDHELLGAKPDNYSVSIKGFEAQIKKAIEHDYKVTSILDLLNCDNENNSVVITFDDGQISNYEVATDILVANKSSADFFINTAVVGDKGYVGWEDLRNMVDSGMSVQSHSHDHIYLTSHGERELLYQLEKSKAMIEDKLATEVSVLSAPGGRINNRIRKLAENAGYKYICDSVPSLWDRSSKYVHRVPVYRNVDMKIFEKMIFKNKEYYKKLLLNYHIKQSMKVMLGNRNYEKVRKLLLIN